MNLKNKILSLSAAFGLGCILLGNVNSVPRKVVQIPQLDSTKSSYVVDSKDGNIEELPTSDRNVCGNLEYTSEPNGDTEERSFYDVLVKIQKERDIENKKNEEFLEELYTEHLRSTMLYTAIEREDGVLIISPGGPVVIETEKTHLEKLLFEIEVMGYDEIPSKIKEDYRISLTTEGEEGYVKLFKSDIFKEDSNKQEKLFELLGNEHFDRYSQVEKTLNMEKVRQTMNEVIELINDPEPQFGEHGRASQLSKLYASIKEKEDYIEVSANIKTFLIDFYERESHGSNALWFFSDILNKDYFDDLVSESAKKRIIVSINQENLEHANQILTGEYTDVWKSNSYIPILLKATSLYINSDMRSEADAVVQQIKNSSSEMFEIPNWPYDIKGSGWDNKKVPSHVSEYFPENVREEFPGLYDFLDTTIKSVNEKGDN